MRMDACNDLRMKDDFERDVLIEFTIRDVVP
jgi:hypothetical protein